MNRWLVMLPLLAGCGDFELSDLKALLPVVTFDRLDLRDVNFQEADVDFVFAVENQTAVPIKLASFGYDLAFEEVQMLEGDNPDGFTLPAGGATELVLPLDLVFVEIWELIQATRGEDIIGFNFGGRLGFDTTYGEIGIPLRTAGEFPALREPQFRFLDVEFTPPSSILDPSVKLNINLGIDNDHESTLLFESFDYKLDLFGVPVATGLIPSFATVDGATEGQVTLPVTVNLLSAGVTIAQALIQQKPLELAIIADMDVSTPFGIVPLHVSTADLVQAR